MPDRQCSDVGPLQENYENQRDDRNTEKPQSDKAVAEFNPDMELTLGLVGNWREGPTRALGPRRASEPRASQPHRPTGDD